MTDNQRLASLVTEAQNGNRAALDALVEESYGDIYYYALKTVKDETLAQDITQESFIEVVTRIGELREAQAYGAWVRRIVYSKAARHFRDTREIAPTETEDGDSILDILPEDSGYALPEQALEDTELAKTIMEMVNALPPEQSSAVLLYYYERRSVRDIALIQNTNEQTVKSRLNYARKAIKAKVEDYEQKTTVRLHSAAFLPILLRFALAGERAAAKVPAIPVLAPATAATAAAASATATAGAAAASATAATAGAATVATTAVGSAAIAKIAAAVVAAAFETYLGFISDEVAGGRFPKYKSFGMAYIRFAKEERELFKLLFMCDRSGMSLQPTEDFTQSIEMIMTANGVDKATAELMHLECWAFVHGIAAMLATSFLELDAELISQMVSDAYMGIRARHLSEVK